MSISGSVGKDARNIKNDVKLVQAALNLVKHGNYRLSNRIEINGKMGADTVAAIEHFQRTVAGATSPDGRIDTTGKTIQLLKTSIEKGLNANSFSAIMANGPKVTQQMYFPLFQSQMPRYQVVTPLRIAHFLAQLGHESLSLTYSEELASGEAYEGRKDLGNNKTGDGKRFKGRGFIQLTGRSNYEAYAKDACLNIMQSGNESLLGTFPYALDVSLWFWKRQKLNVLADADDLRGITRRVNGGYNGLPDRQQYLDRAKYFLI